jgi:hypothetical protein
MYKVECNTFFDEVSNDVFLMMQHEWVFYSHQGIDGDKVMENINLLIGHKHGKEIYLIEKFVEVIMEGNYLMFVGTHRC